MDASFQPGRSVSMPSRFHHNSLEVVEEALNKLRSQDVSMASTSGYVGTTETIHLHLISLVELYGYLQELILFPSTRQALVNLCRGEVEEALDASLSLLDTCTTAGNLILKLKEHVNELQSALRRKGPLSIEDESSVYLGFRKRMMKDVAKWLRGLKQLESKYGLYVALPVDPRLAMIVRVQREVYAVTISVLRSLFVFLSIPTKDSGWTLISKLLMKGARASSDRNKVFNEVAAVDIALNSDAKMDMQLLQARLHALDASVRCLEGELESLSKCLVKTRVLLLNILTC